jgi:hypothetical protein
MEINSPSHLEFWLIKSKEQNFNVRFVAQSLLKFEWWYYIVFINYDLIVNMKTILFVSFGNVLEIYNVIFKNMGLSWILNIIYISCATINASSWNQLEVIA